MVEFSVAPAYRNIINLDIYNRLLDQVDGNYYAKSQYVVPYSTYFYIFVIKGATVGVKHDIYLDGRLVHGVVPQQETEFFSIDAFPNQEHDLWVQMGSQRTKAIKFVITRYATLLAGLANNLSTRQLPIDQLISRIKSRLDLYTLVNVIDKGTYELLPSDNSKNIAVRAFSNAVNNQGTTKSLIDIGSAITGNTPWLDYNTGNPEIEPPAIGFLTERQLFAGVHVNYWHPSSILARKAAFDVFIRNFPDVYALESATDLEVIIETGGETHVEATPAIEGTTSESISESSESPEQIQEELIAQLIAGSTWIPPDLPLAQDDYRIYVVYATEDVEPEHEIHFTWKYRHNKTKDNRWVDILLENDVWSNGGPKPMPFIANSFGASTDLDAPPHIVYYDHSHTRVRYGVRDSEGNWAMETVSQLGGTWGAGIVGGIVVDSTNRAHIVFNKNGIAGRPIYAYKDPGGPWRFTYADPTETTTICPSMGISLCWNDRVDICYACGPDVDHLKPAYSAWKNGTVFRNDIIENIYIQSSGGQFQDFAINTDGNMNDGTGEPCVPNVCYYPSGTPLRLRWGNRWGGSWSLEDVVLTTTLKHGPLAISFGAVLDPYIAFTVEEGTAVIHLVTVQFSPLQRFWDTECLLTPSSGGSVAITGDNSTFDDVQYSVFPSKLGYAENNKWLAEYDFPNRARQMDINVP